MKNGDGEGNGANERQFENPPLSLSPKSRPDRFGYALDGLGRRRWHWGRSDGNHWRPGNFRAAIWAIELAGFDLLSAVVTGWPAHQSKETLKRQKRKAERAPQGAAG